MLTSAKSTGYSTVMVFSLELLSQLKSNYHEIFCGTSVIRGFVSSGLEVFEVEAK